MFYLVSHRILVRRATKASKSVENVAVTPKPRLPALQNGVDPCFLSGFRFKLFAIVVAVLHAVFFSRWHLASALGCLVLQFPVPPNVLSPLVLHLSKSNRQCLRRWFHSSQRHRGRREPTHGGKDVDGTASCSHLGRQTVPQSRHCSDSQGPGYQGSSAP
jgi:hypothetical protein